MFDRMKLFLRLVVALERLADVAERKYPPRKSTPGLPESELVDVSPAQQAEWEEQEQREAETLTPDQTPEA
jgi:hypothetical protein